MLALLKAKPLTEQSGGDKSQEVQSRSALQPMFVELFIEMMTNGKVGQGKGAVRRPISHSCFKSYIMEPGAS
jgi:hypothetical protein